MPPRAFPWLVTVALGLCAAPASAGWTLQHNGTGQDQGFFQISVFDDTHAMAVGTHNDPSSSNTTSIVAMTTDGQTWTTSTPKAGTPGPMGMEVYASVHMVSATKAFIGSTGKLISTTDGGATWSAYAESGWGPLKGPMIAGLSFAGPQDGILVGAAGTLRVTHDGGTTWTPLTSPVTGLDWAGALMKDPQHLWIWAGSSQTDDQGNVTGWQDGALALSTDGGATFTVVFQGDARGIGRVFMINFKEGYLISNSMTGPTLEHTTDGGATWTKLTIPGGPDTIDDVFFFDLCEGMVFAEQSKSPIIGYTQDAGDHWTALSTDGLKVTTPLPVHPAARMIAFDFTSRSHGFGAGGYEALAVYTPDGDGPGCGTGMPDGGGPTPDGGHHAAGGGGGGCGCRAAGGGAGALGLGLGLVAALAVRRRRGSGRAAS